MEQNLLGFLRDMDFTEIMSAVYLGLIELGKGSIKSIQQKIKPQANISYSQVNHALASLVKLKAVEIQKGVNEKYFVVDPESFFEKLTKQKLDKINTYKMNLSEIYKRNKGSLGKCTIQTNYFYFSSIEMGYQIISDKFIRSSKRKIVFLCAPPILIRKLKFAIEEAYNKGVIIEFHYSDIDFEEISNEIENYSYVIKSILTNIRIKIIKRRYRVHDAIAINDEYTRLGHLIIDDKSLIDFPYYKSEVIKGKIQYDLDYIAGFAQFSIYVKRSLEILNKNPIIMVEENIPPKETLILEYLQTHSKVSKNIISKELGISGTELKLIIGKLVSFNKIKLEIDKSGKGRPKEYIKLN